MAFDPVQALWDADEAQIGQAKEQIDQADEEEQ